MLISVAKNEKGYSLFHHKKQIDFGRLLLTLDENGKIISIKQHYNNIKQRDKNISVVVKSIMNVIAGEPFTDHIPTIDNELELFANNLYESGNATTRSFLPLSEDNFDGEFHIIKFYSYLQDTENNEVSTSVIVKTFYFDDIYDDDVSIQEAYNHITKQFEPLTVKSSQKTVKNIF